MNTQVAQTVLGPMNGHKERAVPSFRCLEVKTKKKTRAIFNNPTSLADIAFFLAAVLMQWKSGSNTFLYKLADKSWIKVSLFVRVKIPRSVSQTRKT